MAYPPTSWLPHFIVLHAILGQEVCQPSAGLGSSLLQVGNVRQTVGATFSQLIPAQQGDYSFTSVMDQLNRTRLHLHATTQILFKVLTKTPDPGAYRSAVNDECCSVLNCAVAGLSAQTRKVVNDCSTLKTYACDATANEKAKVNNKGVLKLSFTGTLSGDPVECGENSCEACTNYRTCAGPSAESETVSVVAGDCVRWEFKSTGEVNWYETFIGLYDEQDFLLSQVFERGKRSEWKHMQLTVGTNATVRLKFMLGAYDYAPGQRALGADLAVRNVATGICLPDECLERSPNRCCYTGDDAPLTEEGYRVLGECCCNKEMEKFISRVIADELLDVCLEAGLLGIVPWFSCEHGLQSLAILKTTLQNVRNGILSPDCPWLAPYNSCPTTLPDTCFTTRPPDPSAHRRRVCGKRS